MLKKYDSYVAGDIGCYTLGALEPLAALHTQICMGASIPFFEGLTKTNPDKKIIAVIGDSTFIHTGINGLISAVYNKANGVIIIMDNSTTAMTGAQDHPGTGMTLKKEKTKKLSLENICVAAGADNVDIIDPFDMKGLKDLLEKRGKEKALSVVICRSACKMIDRTVKSRYKIDETKCKKCGKCIDIDCPAIIKQENGEMVIISSRCTGCGMCAQICPFGAIVQDNSDKKNE